MSGTRMHSRKGKFGSYKISFYHIHEDQLELIKRALQIAREEGESDFDSVALDGICLSYLASLSPRKDK